VIPLAFVALLLPGLAWWAWLGCRREDPLVSLAQIVGVGLAVIILLAQVGFLLGTHFSRVNILTLSVIFALIAADGLVKKGVRIERRYQPHLVIGFVLLGLTIAYRLFQARDLVLPNWVDSQHHFLVIRVILEQGGLPHDLSPYLPVPLYYHYGYHAIAALFTAISGMEVGDAMLVLGQVLNALIGLSVYALGKSLWHNWRPALAVALLISFATRMPAYYLSWGRYTLTTGLVLLPVAMALAHDLIMRRKYRMENALSLALLTAALLLTHYFAALLLAGFMGLLVIVHLLQNRRRLPRAFLRISLLINSAALGLLLTLPWLWRVAQYTHSSAGIQTNLPKSFSAVFSRGSWDYTWQLLGPTSNHWLLLPAAAGLILALTKRHTMSFGLWSLALMLMALPWGLSLAPFRPDHFVIVLFLPITLLAGWLIWLAARWIGRQVQQRWVAELVLILVVLGWKAWGFTQTHEIVNPSTLLVTPADLEALEWVGENTPEDARFFINTTHWMGNIYRGTDGGGWLLPYTGRWALVPTVFYGYSPDSAWAGELRSWGQAASQVTGCTDEFWTLVEEAELSWVYLRTGAGSLQPSGLAGCEGVELEYFNQGVSVYRINHP